MVAFLDPLYARLILQCQIKKKKNRSFKIMISWYFLNVASDWWYLILKYYSRSAEDARVKCYSVERWARGICKSCNGNGKIVLFARNYFVNKRHGSQMLEQMIWMWKHTSHTKVYFNEFVANVLHDNMGMIIFDFRGCWGC